MEIEDMLKSLTADEQSIQIVADYLGYSVGRNPNEPESEWRMLFTDKIPDKTSAVLALKTVSDLTLETKTMDIRKLHKRVEELAVSFGGSFDAEIAGFVGQKRIVLFRLRNGNRDERLDLNEETIEKVLYLDNFNMLKNSSITVEQDAFWGEYVIHGLKDVFKRELTNHFLMMVALYRKKLSELITSKPYKNELAPLVSDNARAYIIKNALTQLVEDESYTAVLSNVVDTIILRQLMRRFIEAYYGKDEVHPFELSGIALGVGRGTLDEAIKETVEIYSNLTNSTESAINKLNKKKSVIEKYDDYVEISLFDEDEYNVTSKIKMKDDSKKRLIELHDKATRQFQTVYGGDLFASSIGEVTTRIENLIVEHDAEMWAKFWIDTSSENYSFRFEDVPPEALEKQYENSMSQNVQIKIEDGKPIVFYGEDLQEQKNKGAYYTDEKFVQYMVQQTVEVEFQNRIAAVKEAIKEDNESEVIKTLDHMFDMKTADLTAGGGSFLRGAFRQLADKHDALVGLKVTDTIRGKYPMMQAGDEGTFAWEKYILHNMVYGVDIDYKAILISSLTLMLSSLQHRPIDQKLPELIGNTLIHQNSLMNSVPFYEREKIYANYQKEIKTLLKLKREQSPKYESKRQELQRTLLQYVQPILNGETQFLNVEALEINLIEVFFGEDGKLKENAGFDCIIGNPPWEIWKPNSDEFFYKYDKSYLAVNNKKAKEAIQKKLFNQFPEIEQKWNEMNNRIKKGSKYFRNIKNYCYQSWKVEGRSTGSDLNLYKIAMERFSQLINSKSILSILMPENLMTDLGSTGLRHLIFDEMQVFEFLSFENSKGIFPVVHRSYKFAILTIKNGKRDWQSFKAFFSKKFLSDLQKEEIKLDYPLSLVIDSEPEKYNLITPRSQVELDLYQKIKLKYPSLGETRLFKMSNDFHRTNDTKYFKEYQLGDVPLYEGKLIGQFRLVAAPKEGVTQVDAYKKLGDDLNEYRIGYRDISSSTNRRTIIATIFPRKAVAANSLFMQINANETTLLARLFYLAMLNSYVLDFVMRKLIDKHVSQTFLKQLPIPPHGQFVYEDDLIQITKELLMLNDNGFEELDSLVLGTKFKGKNYNQLVAELNARIAIGFDLNRDELINLLRTFESANHKQAVQEEAQRIIEVYDRLKVGEAS
ncbi:Eco57I restriction-modification methylase domain-containing protein [Enterococcus faecium]|uniref:Eco57I restriction-modification methylase domain-containing protein n=2 Tax=Enterococcus faecium TaxID=1352 RepID=UPI0009BDC310|nr:adenine methyltransferase [Enterococcus faecium]EJC3745189.1 adenine methyltransferase [Enterococcus faecium]OQO65015.1 adenine methyltransferase [Enterococcus faecium]